MMMQPENNNDRLQGVSGEPQTSRDDFASLQFTMSTQDTDTKRPPETGPRQGIDRFHTVGILYNPISSKGNSKEKAEEVATVLKEQNIDVSTIESKASYAAGELEQFCDQHDLLIVIGGDGTLMGTLSALANTQIPVYMIPAGNESLFSRRHQMSANPGDLLSRLKEGSIEQHYFSTVNDTPFFTMGSMGFDSAIISSIGRRTGRLSNLIYLTKGIRELFRYENPTVSITVDGKEVVNKQQGYLLVANDSSFARGIDPLPEASSSKAELCVGFVPNAGKLFELEKTLHMALRRPFRPATMQHFSGNTISITMHADNAHLQVDGDYFEQRPLQEGETLTFKSSHIPIRVVREAAE